jgi:hypothetical protein
MSETEFDSDRMLTRATQSIRAALVQMPQDQTRKAYIDGRACGLGMLTPAEAVNHIESRSEDGMALAGHLLEAGFSKATVDTALAEQAGHQG